MGFQPRIGSKLLIDATRGPELSQAMQDYFEPVYPVGYKEVRLEDYIT